MVNTDKTFNQIKQIDDFMNIHCLKSYELRNANESNFNSISIPLINGYQIATLLSRIEQLKPGTIHKPEEIAITFDSAIHKYLILTS
jgi:hypothetical protein